jgi:hypothetical protein
MDIEVSDRPGQPARPSSLLSPLSLLSLPATGPPRQR